MEGFKKLPKVQHFKEGGSVKYETRKEHKEEVSADVAQDKKIIKKAFKMHDEQEHKGEHTNLSKLKKGGRAKKEKGTVRKYRCGGDVKKMQAGGVPAAAPLAQQGAISDVERAALQGALPGGQGMGSANDMERRRMMERAKNAMKYLGPQQQNEFVKQGGMSPTGVAGQKKGGKVKK